MFTGLSAFPLTPMNEQGIHEREFIQLVSRLAQAKVDSIGVLGSTGSYAYLNVEERARVAKLSVEHGAVGFIQRLFTGGAQHGIRFRHANRHHTPHVSHGHRRTAFCQHMKHRRRHPGKAGAAAALEC